MERDWQCDTGHLAFWVVMIRVVVWFIHIRMGCLFICVCVVIAAIGLEISEWFGIWWIIQRPTDVHRETFGWILSIVRGFVMFTENRHSDMMLTTVSWCLMNIHVEKNKTKLWVYFWVDQNHIVYVRPLSSGLITKIYFDELLNTFSRQSIPNRRFTHWHHTHTHTHAPNQMLSIWLQTRCLQIDPRTWTKESPCHHSCHAPECTFYYLHLFSYRLLVEHVLANCSRLTDHQEDSTKLPINNCPINK